MSTNCKVDLPTNPLPTEITRAEIIRNAMSLNNLLNKPTANPKGSEADEPDSPHDPLTTVKDSVPSPSVSSDTLVTEPVLPDSISEQADEDVPDSQREFICMNDRHTRCQTGQYTKDLSRKVISDHFGRNKTCTRDITEWPLFCRKHYQRATYDKAKWQIRKAHLILRQFDIIEKQFPGTTYKVTLKKSEEIRLNQYSRQVASGMSAKDAEKCVAPVVGKHFEAPVEVLRELDLSLGRGKTYKEVRDIVDVILQMLEGNECEQVPAIEFLPELPAKSVSPVTVPTKAPVAKSTRSSKRVSNKGSIKKTSQKA
ncbi:hypothetical protein COCC4DRAFT_59115 [Bipolaris maydis ATCC 48331]|uniref:Uncharacterized protein n=1 Tax=Cochliobolus heterostrophus (strain C4 / ATCC 48331 / race T) TaxID=665024 RepID=N4X6J0_COCH4|nr:uncharacterized protein COCC4DRAFT_59115 [Bipolaris maydis ATCC 48331]ENI07295.1 hypothetical protein COCC4DRAFT_59115 [Bipolaris maydis ATCC 48331]KAJ5027595.1 hypothetical protein J3E73DRAFT_389596 [Bipolaris maydis]KAJ6266760.1 hypothetical protein PSV08DRAFT_189003 [Bipolaris maydis]KAJ6282904.1 hypothetical protein J3E71DRAFT_360521 [Bipolaris maydis]